MVIGIEVEDEVGGFDGRGSRARFRAKQVAGRHLLVARSKTGGTWRLWELGIVVLIGHGGSGARSS